MGLNLEGFYSSIKGFEKYDQSSYGFAIKFHEDGTVEKDVPHEGEFHRVGYGKYTKNGDSVVCIIKSEADGFESKWRGKIYKDYIQFEIEKPDYEDIAGRYTFVQNTNT